MCEIDIVERAFLIDGLLFVTLLIFCRTYNFGLLLENCMGF